MPELANKIFFYLLKIIQIKKVNLVIITNFSSQKINPHTRKLKNNEVQQKISKEVYFQGKSSSFISSTLKRVLDECKLLKLPLSIYDTNEVLTLRKEQIKLYKKLGDTSNINTIDRINLRNSLINHISSQNAAKEKKAFIVVGLPGSGKTSFLIPTLKKNESFVNLTSDDVVVKLPEFQNGKGLLAVSKETTNILEGACDKCISQDKNILLHTTGLWFEQIKNFYTKARKAGYSVHLHFVKIDPKEALQNTIKRTKNGDQHLCDPFLLAYRTNRPEKNYKKLVELGCESHKTYLNTNKISNLVPLD